VRGAAKPREFTDHHQLILLLSNVPVGAQPDPAASDRPRVLYISYDGASEPLGRSQVVSYLVRLASDCDIALISFEKRTDDPLETRALLNAVGITWIPLRYHRRPPVFSTAWDIMRGAMATRRAVRRHRTQIIHVRSYVAGMIALLSSRTRPWKFLFDIRGFWVDERVEGGIWPRNGWLYRLGKRCERWLFASADAVVTLTRASVPQIKSWLGPSTAPVRVIPTCVALERYEDKARRAQARVTWCGSIGTFYRFDLALPLSDALGLPLTVLTRQIDLARAVIGDQEADVRTAAHERIADELAPGDIGLCLYSTGFSNLARAPTRFAEYLAAGMVVAVSPGIGDLDALVSEHAVGAVIESDTPDAVPATAEKLRRLSEDPAVSTRARDLAARLFSLDAGVRDYLSLYRDLLDGAAVSRSGGTTAAERSALAS
jgi:glycosyltransferase involved in cell wall biosynthesis